MLWWWKILEAKLDLRSENIKISQVQKMSSKALIEDLWAFHIFQKFWNKSTLPWIFFCCYYSANLFEQNKIWQKSPAMVPKIF